MKKLNRRFFVIIAAALAVVMGIAYTMHQTGKAPAEDIHMPDMPKEYVMLRRIDGGPDNYLTSKSEEQIAHDIETICHAARFNVLPHDAAFSSKAPYYDGQTTIKGTDNTVLETGESYTCQNPNAKYGWQFDVYGDAVEHEKAREQTGQSEYSSSFDTAYASGKHWVVVARVDMVE